MAVSWQLARNAFGALVFTDASGVVHAGVFPVRAFPIHAPECGVALVSAEGRELLWLEEGLSALPVEVASLLREALASREFMPKIKKIFRVSAFACPCEWGVETDRGQTVFVLKGEEDIRRLGPNKLLIADSHGVEYLVDDTGMLDRQSRRILDRFL